MDRVEHFIREGVAHPKSPWIAVGRQIFLLVIFAAVVCILSSWNSVKEQRALLTEQEFSSFIAEHIFICLEIFLVISIPFAVYILFGTETRLRIKAWRQSQAGGQVKAVYSPDAYTAAAKALREFKPMTVKEAKEKYGQDVINLLILSGAIWFNKGKLHRMVSIRAIEEGREAGPKDR